MSKCQARLQTRDDASQTVDSRGLYTTRLSDNIERTPEGYLLCRNVPLARTGTMDYHVDDFKGSLAGDELGRIVVTRSDDEVFKDEAIASFEGKPVTIGHPPEFLSPSNWRKYSVGFTRDVRKGEGEHANSVVGDLLITDQTGIDLVNSGVREVSNGYDATYTQDAPGSANQSNIYGNHVAIVARGRAGSNHAIRDEAPKMKASDYLKKLLGVKTDDELKTRMTDLDVDTSTLDEELGEPATPTTDELLKKVLDGQKSMGDRIAKLETGDATPTTGGDAAETDDAPAKTTDDDESAKTVDASQFVSRAEIIVPGAATRDGEDGNAFRRRVLQDAITGDNKDAVLAIVGDEKPADMDAATLDAKFLAAAEVVRQRNNAMGTRSGVSTRDFGASPKTPAELNEIYAKQWADN